jgi:hypothetical protein
LRYDDYIYKDYVATPQVLVNGQIYPNPIIELGSSDIVTFSFDDLDADEKDYFYKVIHCDKDWNPTNLLSIQYLNGFDQEQIETFRFSASTYIPYTHYYFALPNRYTDFKISGNYLMVIYEGTEDNLVLSRRFMVYENMTGVGVNNIPASDVANIRYKQQMQLRLSTSKLEILDPFNDIFVHVLQNNRWDNAKNNLQPRFVRDGLMIFDDFGSLSFWGGNEFRYFDLRNLPSRGPNVQYIDRSNREYEVLLKLATPRDQKHYIYYYDFNGKFLIESRFNGGDLAGSIIDQLSNTLPDELDPALYDYKLRGTRLTQEATILTDYAYVTFNLKASKYYGKEVYIYGALSDWQIRPEFKMQYDDIKEIYMKEALIKQGFYDYAFATVDEKGNVTLNDIEGSWDDTENDYSFLVYFRDFGALYDRLVGYSTFSSLN